MRKDNLFNSDTANKIISVVIALLLWAYVIGEVNPTTQNVMKDIPVQLLNTETLTSRGLVVTGTEEFTVSITLEGKRRDMVNLSAEDIVVDADLFGFSKGENAIPIIVSVPENVKILEVKPAKIKVNVEELVAEIRPVQVSFQGTMPEGTEAGFITIEPREAQVTGAKSYVDAVATLRATVDAAVLTEETTTIHANINPVDKDGNAVINVKSDLSSATVTASLCTVKEVPLEVETIGDLASGFSISSIDVPKTIKIKGPADVVKDIDSIQAESVDINQISKSTSYPLKLSLPENVEPALGYEGLMLEIEIGNLANRQLSYRGSEVIINGLPEGYKAEVVTDAISVSVAGSDTVINSLTKGDVPLTIDLKNTTTGTVEATLIPVTVFENLTIILDPKVVIVSVVKAY